MPFSQSNMAILCSSSAADAANNLPSLLKHKWFIPFCKGCRILTLASPVLVFHIDIKGYGPISPVATYFFFG